MDPLRRKVKPIQRRKRCKPLSEEVRNMYKILTVTVAILAITTTGAYLYVNSLAPAKGYTLKQMQIDYEDLQSEQRKLDKKIIEAQSFINIESSIPDGMETGSDLDFSYVDESTYAQNY